MFIIKLPPNLQYYSTGVQNKAASEGDVNKLETNTSVGKKIEAGEATYAIKDNSNGKKVSFPFSSNGRPGRIYHWNLPVIKKILEDKQRYTHIPAATKNHLIDIKDIPTWRKPWENEAAYENSFNINNDHNNSHSEARAGSHMMTKYKKSLKRKSPTYYAPKTAVNNSSFNKYFSGNGKPKGFYVFKENEKKPLYYKNIIS